MSNKGVASTKYGLSPSSLRPNLASPGVLAARQHPGRVSARKLLGLHQISVFEHCKLCAATRRAVQQHERLLGRPPPSRLPAQATAVNGSEPAPGKSCARDIEIPANDELASRLSAPAAVQHSSDAKAAAAPIQPHVSKAVFMDATAGVSANGSSSSESSTPGTETTVTGVPVASVQSAATGKSVKRQRDRGPPAPDPHGADRCEHPPEIGVVPGAKLTEGSHKPRPPRGIVTDATILAQSSRVKAKAGNLFLPAEQSQIRSSWRKIMRWSKVFNKNDASVLEATHKVVVFGGGSFGTAIGAALARQKSDLDVTLLLRDPYLCQDINTLHCNRRYLQDFMLPDNVKATTSMKEAIANAQFAVHAVPVQHSRRFLDGIKGVLPPEVPIISVSKGLEVSTGQMMSEIIPSALQRKQPAVFLSGPSFAREVMELCPTVVVAASKDIKLARVVQQLLAGPYMRVNTSTDVTGVEICGALKNVLAIAAGIVQGLELGNNAMAALLSQGCAEIRWLAEKMGAKPATVSGLSGLGDIMLTCYGTLSRNRSVGVRLGQGEALEDILASSSQVAEGVSTAAAVVGLSRKYRVALPVLTAVAQVLDGNLGPMEVVQEIMHLPQIEEK